MSDREFEMALAGIERMSDEQMASLRFIDVEASGLHDTSYPIEIAWCGLDLRPVSMLLRPLPHWGEEDWSPESEKVHGISRELLVGVGLDPRKCAEEMAAAMRGCMVFSDAPEFDARWLHRLFSETGVTAGFGLMPIEAAQAMCARRSDPPFRTLAQMMQVIEDAGRAYRHTHRAGDDCLRMAAQCLALADSAWRDGLGKAAAGRSRPPRS